MLYYVNNMVIVVTNLEKKRLFSYFTYLFALRSNYTNYLSLKTLYGICCIISERYN